jgi:hypothetical protein
VPPATSIFPAKEIRAPKTNDERGKTTQHAVPHSKEILPAVTSPLDRAPSRCLYLRGLEKKDAAWKSISDGIARMT